MSGRQSEQPERAPGAPLARVVVADFTQILAGPLCTQMLADAGADIIKIESPSGEFSRSLGHRRAYADGQVITAATEAVNRGKRSIGLDLKNPEGLRVARSLVDCADVVVENFSPGTMERLGLDFKELRARRPELITCSISLFGGFERAGDLAKRRGLAVIAEAEAGVSVQALDSDGLPVRVRLAFGDVCSGMAACSAIVLAVLDRYRTSVGRHLDISMVSTMLAVNAYDILAEQVEPGRGSESGGAYGFFPASDGSVAIGVNSDLLFARLAQAMDKAWMAEDHNYGSATARSAGALEVDRIIGDWTAARTMKEIVKALTVVGVPAGIVAKPSDVLDGEFATKLGMLQAIEDGYGGTLLSPAAAHTYRRVGSSAVPRAGQHTREILSEKLGLGNCEYDELREAGAFG